MYEKFLNLLDLSGKTSYQVAKDTGVSTATLSNWKQGNYQPKIQKLKVLAEYFGVTVNYFVETGCESNEQ